MRNVTCWNITSPLFQLPTSLASMTRSAEPLSLTILDLRTVVVQAAALYGMDAGAVFVNTRNLTTNTKIDRSSDAGILSTALEIRAISSSTEPAPSYPSPPHRYSVGFSLTEASPHKHNRAGCRSQTHLAEPPTPIGCCAV